MARVPAGTSYVDGAKHRRGGQFAPKHVIYQRIQDALQSGDYETATELSKALRTLQANNLLQAPEEFQPPRQQTGTKPTGRGRNYAQPVAERKAAGTRPSVQMPSEDAPESFDESIFPASVPLSYHGRTLTFTRADVASDTSPKGLMVTAGRALTDEEKDHLAGLTVYLHRVHSGVPIEDGDVKFNFGKRSIYLDTKFQNNNVKISPKEFWGELLSIAKTGTPVKKDGSQKWPPLGADFNLVVYEGVFA